MRKTIFTTVFFSLFMGLMVPSVAQIITDPLLPTASGPITITFDATQGSGNLAGYTGDVYAHTGVDIEGGRRWQYVIGNWNNNQAQPKLTRIDTDLYELVIEPDIHTFYNIPADSVVATLNFVFRASGGSPQTEDLFVEVLEPGLAVRFLSPTALQPIYEPGDPMSVLVAASDADSVALFINGAWTASTTQGQLTHQWVAAESGGWHLEALAFAGEEDVVSDQKTLFVLPEEPPVAELPEGVVPGINYVDDQSVTLVLHDPPALKQYVFALGDHSQWQLTDAVFMNRTPDGTHFWITLDDLEPDTEYGFQYYIDGEIRIPDPYAHKVLDPWNDVWIDDFNYPNLKSYPEGKTHGLVSIIHPGHTPYQWQTNDFTPPAKEDMVVYELLIRDFVETSAIKTVMDSLDYLQNLGVNVIELMPVNQFEGNISWGYNPAMYFATDKAYGTREDYKRFIDAAHSRGMAVVIDMVLNHSFNLSPLVQMYFDPDAGSWGAPSADNSWFLTDCPHPPWCWGNTFDQDSPHVHEFFNRVTEYWLTEFRVDGFRLDFTKGFTNEQSGNQGWNYDAARIANLKRIADHIWSVNPNTYVILEHFTANNEEKELAEYGMLIWGNVTHSYQEASMGWLDDSNFEWISYQERDWDNAHLVGYMESHDEERMVFKNLTYGNASNPAHNVRNLEVALRRSELAAAFYFPIPGPKMIWQFGELGYDFSINHCEDGSIRDACRTDPKPVRWDYYDDWRRKRLYDVYGALANLKTSHDVFRTDNYDLSLDGQMKRIHLYHDSKDVAVLGNFGVQAGDINPHFSTTGTWYEYFTRQELEVTNVNQSIELQPGEYRMYSTQPFPDHGLALNVPDQPVRKPIDQIRVYPNPVRGAFTVDSPAADIVEVLVIDMVGRTVVAASPGVMQVSVSTESLHPGVYFVRIHTRAGVVTERIQVIR